MPGRLPEEAEGCSGEVIGQRKSLADRKIRRSVAIPGHVRLLILCCCLGLVCAAEVDCRVSVAAYPGGCQAAYSLCFDGGLRAHGERVVPALEARGLRATFYLIPGLTPDDPAAAARKAAGDWGAVSWDRWREIATAGHELANKSWSHPYLTRIDRSRWHREVVVARNTIARKTGVTPTSFAFPFDAEDADLRAFVAESHSHLRLGAQLLGHDVAAVVDRARHDGGWGIGVIQGIDEGAEPVAMVDLEAHLDHLVSLTDEVWTAPVGEVAAYLAMRERVRAQILPRGDGSWELRCTTPTEERQAATPVELSIQVRGLASLESASAQRGDAELPVVVLPRSRSLRLSLVPGPEPVVIRFSGR